MIIVFESDYTNLDRWFPLDRYPRQLFKKLIKKGTQLTGQSKALENTRKGLDKLGFNYMLNPKEKKIQSSEIPVMLFGQTKVNQYIEKYPNVNFIVGPALYSHPIENPRLAEYENVKTIIVPGPWMKRMCEEYWGDKVVSWPVGIDTDEWSPQSNESEKKIDFLIYNKIMWGDEDLIKSIEHTLEEASLSFRFIKYGQYNEEEYRQLLKQSRAMIFLCEHETQGIAYQQALSMGIPILAWDREGYWLDPRFYPYRIKYKPISSVPYWNDKCGEKFKSMDDFPGALKSFVYNLNNYTYDPRSFVVNNLSLDVCTKNLLSIYECAQD